MKSLVMTLMMMTYAAATPLETYMAELQANAPLPFDAARGAAIFDKKVEKEGEMINCRSCHGADLTKPNKNFKTGKAIEALAPSVNKERLTSIKEMKKWLRRNFKDVYSREGTDQEKGDVLLFISKQ